MEKIKTTLLDCINKLNEENVADTKTQVLRLFDFIELSQSIWGTIPEFVFSNELQQDDLPNNSSAPESSNENCFPLDRKLKGGILYGTNGEEIFVPEKVIRMNGFVHGDYIEPIGRDPRVLHFIKRKNSLTEKDSNIPFLFSLYQSYLIEFFYLIQNRQTRLNNTRMIVIKEVRRNDTKKGEDKIVFRQDTNTGTS